MSTHTHEHTYACMTIWEWGGCSGCAVRRERSQGGGGWLEGAQSGGGRMGEGLVGNVEGDGGCTEGNNSAVAKALTPVFRGAVTSTRGV